MMVGTPTNAVAQLEKSIKTSRGFNLLHRPRPSKVDIGQKRERQLFSGAPCPHGVNVAPSTLIREYRLEPGGITVGPPILQFQGVLTGVPTLVGAIDVVMPAHGQSAR